MKQNISLEITLTEKQAERVADFLMDVAKGLLIASYGSITVLNVFSIFNITFTGIIIYICLYLSLEITKEFS